MSTLAIVVVTLVAGTVALVALVSWRDVRVARWTQRDPRLDRQARRAAEKQVRES